MNDKKEIEVLKLLVTDKDLEQLIQKACTDIHGLLLKEAKGALALIADKMTEGDEIPADVIVKLMAGTIGQVTISSHEALSHILLGEGEAKKTKNTYVADACVLVIKAIVDMGRDKKIFEDAHVIEQHDGCASCGTPCGTPCDESNKGPGGTLLQ